MASVATDTPTTSAEGQAAPGETSPPRALAAGRLGRSVSGQLGIFAAALVLPILLFAGIILWQAASSERARVEGDAADASRAIASTIDRDLSGLFAAIEVLANSSYLEDGDLVGFRRQALALQNLQGVATILADLDGRQLVNTAVPADTILPNTAIPVDQIPPDATRPVVTDLYRTAISRVPSFAVATLVRRDGQPVYRLAFALPSERLQRLFQDADIPPGATVSVVDRRGVILARNTQHEAFVGREATRDLRANTTGRQGSWIGTTADGREVYATYARSLLSDFVVAVGVSRSDLDAPLRTVLSLFAGLFVVISALSTVLAVSFGQRITRPITALTERAAALGRGEPVRALDTGLREANQVGAELVAASAALIARETDLREANDEMQRFAYIVSHDLRAPLVNIMGFTTELEALRADMFGRLDELAKTASEAERGGDRQLGADFDEAIGFIKASIGKMDRLINAILRLSREGRRQFKPERVDMEALVEGIRASLAHQADAAGATIAVSRLPSIVSDRLALEQIFTNLVDNALKYLRSGVPGRIEVSGRSTPGGLVFEVRDNGRGIDPKDRERVFELFRRSGVQDRPGEGIGLAHVRALVRRLGGTIGLTSEPGRGSTFTVTLPRRWAGDAARTAA